MSISLAPLSSYDDFTFLLGQTSQVGSGEEERRRNEICRAKEINVSIRPKNSVLSDHQ